MSGLSTKWLGQSLAVLEETASTVDYLKQRALTLPSGAAVIAKRQTAGKGRGGKAWASGGLMTSFLLRDIPVERLSALPLAAGLAVARAMEKLTGAPGFGLKWSNDVVYGGKKLSGILFESRIDGALGRGFAVSGIGINLEQSTEEFERLGLLYAASIKSATGKSYGILPVCHAVFNEFEPLFEKYMAEGFSAFRQDYKARCVTLGREIRVITGETETRGLARDIAEDGALVLETPSGESIIRAGEASVRGMYGYSS